ncbi:hypothetical protein JCM15457_615 [Liquorilactobacillus sucicola DSM 21376 = JCM 15457]|uniref:NTP pyrophosphohydrolase MazG putative catalytic core domain-containing protein n=1 Tax=Liquorilactobacillus sucicola DSM 21376 = JCM 15457 TaxID=1423806 RepID=A0A023CV61_9LACO|nr:MazG-like family protein [Liquorilactobacillus sucicola]KRN05651.1 hypothetical protein FD15_GL002215 [Liquorilactobacillus sucicola DSM 21376 = JCM 15457]GAJ25737.1 hypothetical protein JCM15457_615 [Liquorilactobacillus sucicola DSM 21376 = JCM 15457]
MTNILSDIKKAAQQEPKNVQQQFLKLMEEVGEAAQAYLSAQKASGNRYKDLDINDTKEELVDVLLVTYAILIKLDISQDELNELLKKKINKWLNKQNN